MFRENLFFLKHCLIAAWMEWQNLPPTDAVFVFDSDVVPYRFDYGLEYWADNFPESIVLYVRAWSSEIAAGNYLVRNTRAGRAFLKGWANYEPLQPPGFSSADNGAIHIHLLRYLGFEQMNPKGKCGTQYTNLVKPVTDLSDYWNYVACTRKHLVTDEKSKAENSTFTKGDFSMRLLPQTKGYVIDAHMDSKPRSGQHAPVFHQYVN
jgi:hypothetical protein